MKKTLLACVAFIVTSSISMLFAQKKVVQEQEQSLDETGLHLRVTHHQYDQAGLLRLSFVENEGETCYTYNEQGQLAEEISYSFDENEQSKLVEVNSSHHVYKYGTNGMVEQDDVYLNSDRLLQSITYAYDAQGNISTMTVLTSNGSAIQIVYQNQYDESGRLVEKTIINPMLGITMNVTTYTYGTFGITLEETKNSAGVVTLRSEYSYDAEGMLQSKSSTTYTYERVVNEDETTTYNLTGQYQTITAYLYGEVAANFVPVNLKAEVGSGNVVNLTWEAPAGGADSYVVFYDNVMQKVEGTEWTTPTLADGTHTFYVASVRNNLGGNMAMVSDVAMKDNTKVGVTDVHLDGEITHEVRQELNSDGVLTDVDYFNIPVAWSLPDDAQPESFRIYYYKNYYYVEVEDGTSRRAVISIPESRMKGFSMTLGEFYYDIEIKVVAIYATGAIDPDNTIVLEESPAVGITTTTTKEKEESWSTIDGRRLQGRPRTKGVYLMNGKKVWN